MGIYGAMGVALRGNKGFSQQKIQSAKLGAKNGDIPSSWVAGHAGRRADVLFKSGATEGTAGETSGTSKPGGDVLISRIVLEGPPKPHAARQILKDALAQLPAGKRTKFLITPGGFIETAWPDHWKGQKGWKSRPEDLTPLVEVAQKAVDRVVTSDIVKAAQGKVSVMTLGVDVISPQRLNAPHAELVAVYDVARRKVVQWTGKSYPLAAQEQTLINVADVSSHAIEIAGERVLVLGCHDLNMFSPRARANQAEHGPRRQVSDAMRAVADGFKPTVVLQHPHGTDTPKIWRPAWCSLQRMLTEVKAWASGICYYNYLNPTGKQRAPLHKVLEQTAGGASPTMNITLNTAQY